MPSLFVSHGSPMEAVEDDAWSRSLTAWAARLERPRGVVVVSAHWEGPLAVTATSSPETIHDFSGFAEELYAIRYPAPGDPALAKDVARLTGAALEPRRGLDHGAWVPLRKLFPAADVPVVQLSIPPAGDVARLGRALADLRKEGVLLIGSGGAVHNLRTLAWDDKAASAADWAMEFDRWVAARAGDVDALGCWRESPLAARAHPTPEHYLPILFVGGSSIETLHEGFHYGSLSMRTYAAS